MTKLECCICSELLVAADLIERVCCLGPTCLQDSPTCLNCCIQPTETIQLNLAQLEAEIKLVTEIGQEQAEFYDRWDCQQLYQLNRNSDAKAVTLTLELLEFLRTRLVAQPNKTVRITPASLIRSKDVYHGMLVDSGGVLETDCEAQRDFFESHRICYRWSHTVPTTAKYLRQLDLAYSSSSEISTLAGLDLTWLSLYHSPIQDLSALSNMISLKYLDLSQTRVTDLTPLRGLALIKLYLGGTSIADITALQGMALIELDLSQTRVTDLTALAGMPLTGLDLSQTAISNITVLAEMPLVDLNLLQTQVVDYSPIQGKPGLVLRSY